MPACWRRTSFLSGFRSYHHGLPTIQTLMKSLNGNNAVLISIEFVISTFQTVCALQLDSDHLAHIYLCCCQIKATSISLATSVAVKMALEAASFGYMTFPLPRLLYLYIYWYSRLMLRLRHFLL